MRHAALCSTFLLLAGGTALAASPAEEAQRLDDLLYFVKALDRGWEPLLGEIRGTLDRLGEQPADELRPIHLLRDETSFVRAEALYASGDPATEEDCIRLFTGLAESAVEESRRTTATERLADLWIRRGERLEGQGDRDGAFAAYLEAVDRAPDYQAGYVKIATLGLEQATEQESALDFETAIDTLNKVKERIERGLPEDHPAVASADGALERILNGTGVLAAEFMPGAARLEAVRGGKTLFRDGMLSIVAAGREAPLSVSIESGRRVRTGEYRVTASGSTGSATFEGDVRVASTGGAFVLPSAIPDGMVYVPAAGTAAAFFIDRTEVSNAHYAPFAAAQGAGSLDGAANLPVRGVTHADAQRYAAWVGKDLPTISQWRQAAFGSADATSPRYPWGDEEGTPGVHFFGARSEPGPVDGCPAGAASCGALNMAGNVFEWLIDDWIIGGHFAIEKFDVRVSYGQPVGGQGTWTADYLRDPMPTVAVWDTLLPETKNKHKVYRVLVERKDSFIKAVGLRCVIPLE